MPLVLVPLNNGRVTSAHPSTLRDGELARAEDCRYRPTDQALYRAWGRTKYINSNGQISGGSVKVKGLAYCPFDPNVEGSSDDFLVAHVADKYYTSVWTARTGTISGTTIDAVGTGAALDVCHAFNRWFLFNGNTEGVANQVLKPATTNPSVRRHGLVPVSVTPTNPIVSTSAGSWPLDDVFWGEGRFFFFTTEVVNPGGTDQLESAFMGEPPHVDLQKDGAGTILFNVTVTRHNPLANSNATQINVYMIKASLNQAWDNSLLSLAFRVGTISVTGTPANDKIVLSSNYTTFDPTTTPTVTTVSGTISSASNAAAEDNAVASVAALGSAVIDLTSWGFAVGAGTAIVGMKMWIKYRSVGVGFSNISAQFRTGAGPTLSIAKAFTTSSDDFVLHQQPWPNSDTDTWGLTLVGTDVNSANFGVRLTINSSGNLSTQIDVVKIRLITTAVPTIGPAYPIVAIQEGNVLTIHHANLPPPTSSTGDIIDGQLVVNNVGNDREAAYSLPGKYDYFPAPYKMTFDLKEKDKVMVIRRVGDLGVVWSRHQVTRINFLPLSTDPEFNQGRAYEVIATDIGCVSTQGVAIFTPHNSPTLAAFVGSGGIYVTEGARVRIISEDVDWDNEVDKTQLSKAVLLNYPKEQVLVFSYIAAGSGATENNRYFLFHYHPLHLKYDEAGRVRYKVTGPNVMRIASGTVAKLGAEVVLLTGHATDGRIYVEDNDVSDASGSGINMLFETREYYPAQPGMKATIKRVWWHLSKAVAGMTATSLLRYRNTGIALTDDTGVAFTTSPEGLVLVQHHLGTVGAVRNQLSIPDAGGSNGAVAVTHAIYDVDEHGVALDE